MKHGNSIAPYNTFQHVDHYEKKEKRKVLLAITAILKLKKKKIGYKFFQKLLLSINRPGSTD